MRAFLGVVVLLSAAAAHADPCTVTTATLSVSLSSRADAGGGAIEIAGPWSIDANWDIASSPNPNVSCSPPTNDIALTVTPSVDNDAGAGIGADLPTVAANATGDGTTAIEADYAGNYVVWGAFTCNCSLLGFNEQLIPSGSIIVPPTILPAPIVEPSELGPNPVPWNGNQDPLPLGDTFSLSPVVSAVLCPADTLSFTVSGAGVNVTTPVPAATTCTQSSFGETISFTPTMVGTITLTATFDGAVSNAVTYTVGTTSGSSSTTSGSGTGGTSGSTSSSGSKGGCGAADGVSIWALLGVAACLSHRRRPTA